MDKGSQSPAMTFRASDLAPGKLTANPAPPFGAIGSCMALSSASIRSGDARCVDAGGAQLRLHALTSIKAAVEVDEATEEWLLAHPHALPG
jgi:hypothetical protein